MVEIDAITAIALSLGLGLLIGVQRGWALRNEEPGSRFAGIRTFGLLGLTGGMGGIIHSDGAYAGTLIIAAAAALVILGYMEVARHGDNVSGTGSLVGLLTLGCGFLAATQHGSVATIVAVLMTLTLAMRSQLHGWIRRLSESEVLAGARFALIALAILPLLPDHAYGPLDAWNPRQLWMVVVMVSGFSFAGYVASRWLGASRGTIATAAAGAMVSSTAVTAALAVRLRSSEENIPILIAGIATASAVMFVRVLLLVGALAPIALHTLAILVLPAALTSVIGAIWYLRAANRLPAPLLQEVAVRNPFDIAPALGLMALVMLVSLISRWVLTQYGDAGLATVLALSGTFDVDSAIITMGGLPSGALDARTAGLVLAAPVMLNTLFKASVAISLAGWDRGWRAAAPLVASVAAGILMLPVLLG